MIPKVTCCLSAIKEGLGVSDPETFGIRKMDPNGWLGQKKGMKSYPVI